jgi:hypothetical protein
MIGGSLLSIHLLFVLPNSGCAESLYPVNGSSVIMQSHRSRRGLEYDPSDYMKLLQPLVQQKADVVYGSRYDGKKITWKDGLKAIECIVKYSLRRPTSDDRAKA